MNYSEKARRLMERSYVANMHDDFLINVLLRRKGGERGVIARDYLKRFEANHVNLVVASLFVDDMFLPNMALEHAMGMIAALYQEREESGNAFAICADAEQLKEARKENKVAIMLSLEGGEPIGGDENMLRVFRLLGVRFLGPCWSRRNLMADGSGYARVGGGKASGAGFTPFGKRVLELCGELGIILDASHIGDGGFPDMAAVGVPLIASHSNARAVYDIERNIPDAQIRQIAEKRGLIGINSTRALVAATDAGLVFDTLLRSADHIIAQASEDVLCFGFDFCGDLISCLPTARPRPKPTDVVRGYDGIGDFIAALLAHGYSEERVQKIAGENAYRFLTQNMA